ncbi:MAG: ABC transporter ATP-binding protein [Thermodesulfobacteriota bacterium]|nr:ABC transporter ATP-binding protein [Thermodesulfobacteriota bacterium]
MIQLKNLSKHYGSVKAVNCLNLSVPRGEIFGFIGPNGAGKTTTIGMMAGLLAPTQGSVIIDGIDMKTDPEKAKKMIGLIPDRPFLYEKLTGMEFLKFMAELYEVKQELFLEKAKKLLVMFSLFNHTNKLIESYSHGMKQRLIMCAVLLHDPLLIIVDEPMVGLDPKGIKMVKNLFRNLAAKGTTIFMSTHTLKLAEEVCNRIGIINKGRLIATGNIIDLMQAANIGKGDLEQVFFHLTGEENNQ